MCRTEREIPQGLQEVWRSTNWNLRRRFTNFFKINAFIDLFPAYLKIINFICTNYKWFITITICMFIELQTLYSISSTSPIREWIKIIHLYKLYIFQSPPILSSNERYSFLSTSFELTNNLLHIRTWTNYKHSTIQFHLVYITWNGPLLEMISRHGVPCFELSIRELNTQKFPRRNSATWIGQNIKFHLYDDNNPTIF